MDAGEPNEYIRDVVSEAAFNIKSGLWRNSEITDPAELLASAQIILEQKKDPRLSYTIQVVDLTFDSANPRNFEAIVLGSKWWVIDEKLSIQTQQLVVKIIRDLRNPLNVRIEITNIPRDLSSLFKRLLRGLEELEVGDPDQGGAPLSDANPENVSSPKAPGTSKEAARRDHVHEIDIEGVILSDTSPTYVPERIVALGSADAGTGVLAAREDHKHGDIATNVADIEDVGDTEAVGSTGRIPDAGHIHGLSEAALTSVLSITNITEISTWNTTTDTGTLDDHMADVLAANPTAVLSDLTPEIVVGLSDGTAGTGVKASREDHEHGGVQLFIQPTEPAAAVWKQGGFWIDTSTAHGDFFQGWWKMGSSGANNDSKVAIALFE